MMMFVYFVFRNSSYFVFDLYPRQEKIVVVMKSSKGSKGSEQKIVNR